MKRIKCIQVHLADLAFQNRDAIKSEIFKRALPFHRVIKSNGDIVNVHTRRAEEETIHIAVSSGKNRKLTRAQENTLFDLLVELTEKSRNSRIENAPDNAAFAFDVTAWLKKYIPDLETNEL